MDKKIKKIKKVLSKELQRYSKLTDIEIENSITKNHKIMDSLINETYNMLQKIKKSKLDKPLDQLPIKIKLFLINETRKSIVVQCYIQSLIKTNRTVMFNKYPYISCIK